MSASGADMPSVRAFNRDRAESFHGRTHALKLLPSALCILLRCYVALKCSGSVDQQRAQIPVTTFADPTKTASCATHTAQEEQLRDLQWQLAQAGKLKHQMAEAEQRMEPTEASRKNLSAFLASNSRF